MYKNFFGLRENPFNTNPDPRFLYVTPQVQQAREQLILIPDNIGGRVSGSDCKASEIDLCVPLLRLWRFELQRDWAAMINAIKSSQMNKALLRWLRQPVSSKAKNSI